MVVLHQFSAGLFGFRNICTVFIVLQIVGCSGVVSPSFVPVTGKVSYKGKPVESGVISFIPVGPDQGMDASAIIEKGGEFKVTTNGSSEGIAPGEYYVTIEPPSSTQSRTSKSKIPIKYYNQKSSGIIETIHAGTPSRHLDLVLTDD